MNEEARPCTDGRATCCRQPPKPIKCANGCLGCLAIFVFVVLSLVLLVLFARMAEEPYIRKFCRYSKMPKDEFLLAASNEVVRVAGITKNGTNFTVVVAGRMRNLASGPAVFVFDEEGRQVDHTRDYNDSSRFRPTWRLTDAIFYPTNFVGGKVSCEGKGREGAPPPK